jgi:hypothetical protein
MFCQHSRQCGLPRSYVPGNSDMPGNYFLCHGLQIQKSKVRSNIAQIKDEMDLLTK